MEKNMCRRCFKTYIDPLATDRLLLLGKMPRVCEGCGKKTHVVLSYFKYGEHLVSEDGFKLVESMLLKPNKE